MKNEALVPRKYKIKRLIDFLSRNTQNKFVKSQRNRLTLKHKSSYLYKLEK